MQLTTGDLNIIERFASNGVDVTGVVDLGEYVCSYTIQCMI